MKRRYLQMLHVSSVALLLLPTVLLGQAAAADVCYSSNCTTTGTSTLFGQTQSYDVLLRGNGEAIVNARISLSNNDTKPLSKLDYNIVSGQLEDVAAFQQVTCTGLPVIRPLGSSGSINNINLSPVANQAGTTGSIMTNSVTSTDIPECYQGLIEHPLNSSSQLPYYYPSADYVYKKINASKSGNSFTLTLPQAIDNNKSSTIVMAYNLSGVSHESFGVFHYDFKTLKSASRVSDVTIAVSVDENYFLADAAKGSVNYRPVTASNALSANVQSGIAQRANSATSSDVSSYVSSIGSNGNVNKHASSLAAQETYTVKGRFASSTFLLNWPRTVFWWILAVLIIAVLVWWYIRNRKKLQGQPPSNQPNNKIDSERLNNASPKAETETIKPEQTVVSQSTNEPASATVRALPFYGLAAMFRRRLQERQIKPIFFAWICGILSVGLIAGVLAGYQVLYNLNYNTYSSTGSINILIPGLYIGLGAIGILGFLFFSVGLPILYGGSFKRAMRIYMHLIVFFIVVGILLVTLAVRMNNNSGECDKFSYNGCGNCNFRGGAAICPDSINQGANSAPLSSGKK